MPKGVKGSGSGTTVLMNLTIEKALRDEFHIWCIRHNTTMKDVLQSFIQDVVDKGNDLAPVKVTPKNLKRNSGVEEVAKFFDDVNRSDSWEDTY